MGRYKSRERANEEFWNIPMYPNQRSNTDAMIDRSRIVADAAEASHDLAPIAIHRNTTVDDMVASHWDKKQ